VSSMSPGFGYDSKLPGRCGLGAVGLLGIFLFVFCLFVFVLLGILHFCFVVLFVFGRCGLGREK
jgi:hypothetical protein